MHDIVGAFGEADAARLTGVTVGQLRAWDRTGFLRPSYAPENRRQPYSRVYSFRDVVSLRVLNSLRNNHKIPLQRLRKASDELAHLGDERWTAVTLYVLNRNVVFDDPETGERREVGTGQRVFNIPLRVAIRDTRKAIHEMNARPAEALGKVIAGRFVMNNRPVFEGTRIPLAAVEDYLRAGFGTERILKEFPELRKEDVDLVREQIDAVA